MTKKDFKKNNPVNRFITQSDEEYEKYQPSNLSKKNEIVEVKKGRPKSDKETKKRISLFMLPSLYEAVGKIAYINKMSIGKQISDCLEKFIEENEEKIKKYDELI